MRLRTGTSVPCITYLATRQTRGTMASYDQELSDEEDTEGTA